MFRLRPFQPGLKTHICCKETDVEYCPCETTAARRKNIVTKITHYLVSVSFSRRFFTSRQSNISNY